MSMLQKIISTSLPPHLVRFDEPMAPYTSFQIGGPADVLLCPKSCDELLSCLKIVRQHRLPFFLLGGGTNILVSDRGVRAVVISMTGLHEISISGDRLTALAGATVENICRAAWQRSLSGVEFIHGMPGTIGGAAWMNARCYGGSIAEVLVEAKVIDEQLEMQSVSCTSEQFAYKKSPFQTNSGCIYALTLQLRPGKEDEILQQMEANLADREAKGHFSAPSAGSLFKNNRDFGAPTGKILDELGLCGAARGGAAIAPFHGNIFINRDGATAQDVLSLIRLAVETARRELNIRLEPEVRLVGEWLPAELAFLTE